MATYSPTDLMSAGIRGSWDESGVNFTPDDPTQVAALEGTKWDFAKQIPGTRQAGNASLTPASFGGSQYLQEKYGASMDAAIRAQQAAHSAGGGVSLWNAVNPMDLASVDPRTFDAIVMPALQSSGVMNDPMGQQYADLLRQQYQGGMAVDAANREALDKAHMKKVMMGLALTGGVMGAGALGAFGTGGAGALGAGAGEAGALAGLSPEALQAIGTGSAIDVGGTGLTMADWLAAQGAPFAGMGGQVGAGQLGAGGLGLGSFGGGGFGVGGNTAIEAGFNAGAGGGGMPSSGGGGPQPSMPSGGGTPGGGGGQWPGAGQPGSSLSPGATQAVTAPPGGMAPAAAGSPVGAAAGAGGSGGGDFLSGILEQFKKNALQLGMMGLSLALTPKDKSEMPEAAQQAVDTTSGARQLGQEYIDAARRGELTAPQAASLEKYKQDAKNQVRQYFASIGQFDSTSRLQAEAQIDQTAVAMQQQLIQQTLNSGLEALGVGTGPLQQAAQYQVGQDRRLQDAMGAFARGLGGIFGQSAGQGQTTGGPAPARPATQTQAPAIMQPQQPASAQPQSPEPYYDPTAP